MSIFIIFFVIFVLYLSLCIMKIIPIFKENKENVNLGNHNKIIKLFIYFMLTKKTNFYNSLRFCMMNLKSMEASHNIG